MMISGRWSHYGSASVAATLADKETAKEDWDAIVTAHIGGDRAHKATQQKLHQE